MRDLVFLGSTPGRYQVRGIEGHRRNEVLLPCRSCHLQVFRSCQQSSLLAERSSSKLCLEDPDFRAPVSSLSLRLSRPSAFLAIKSCFSSSQVAAPCSQSVVGGSLAASAPQPLSLPEMKALLQGTEWRPRFAAQSPSAARVANQFVGLHGVAYDVAGWS